VLSFGLLAVSERSPAALALGPVLGSLFLTLASMVLGHPPHAFPVWSGKLESHLKKWVLQARTDGTTELAAMRLRRSLKLWKEGDEEDELGFEGSFEEGFDDRNARVLFDNGYLPDVNNALASVPAALGKLLSHPPDMALISMATLDVFCLAAWIPDELVGSPQRIYLFDCTRTEVDCTAEPQLGAPVGLVATTEASALEAMQDPDGNVSRAAWSYLMNFDLSGARCEIQPEVGVALGQLLGNSSQLKFAWLRDNESLGTAACLENVVRGIGRGTPSIEELDFANSIEEEDYFDKKGIQPEAGVALGQLLGKCPQLKKVGLRDNHSLNTGFGPGAARGLEGVVRGIGSGTLSIEELELERIIQPEAGAALGQLLAKCPQLKKLNLSTNDSLGTALEGVVRGIGSGTLSIEALQLSIQQDLLLRQDLPEVFQKDVAALGQLLAKCPRLRRMGGLPEDVGEDMRQRFPAIKVVDFAPDMRQW
jgi:hypothetical protein